MYSKSAMPQLTRIAIQSAELRNFKCPYQARFMNRLEIVSRMMFSHSLDIDRKKWVV